MYLNLKPWVCKIYIYNKQRWWILVCRPKFFVIIYIWQYFKKYMSWHTLFCHRLCETVHIMNYNMGKFCLDTWTSVWIHSAICTNYVIIFLYSDLCIALTNIARNISYWFYWKDIFKIKKIMFIINIKIILK